MYEPFYNLQAEPFRLSPDHRFCFNHHSYAKAKSYMQYAFLRAEGFVMITGKPGTGKTTLVNDLVDGLSPAEVSVAMLVSTQLDADDLLRMVAYSFGLEGDMPHKAAIIQRLIKLLINQYKDGRRALLIIDEAQDLSVSALEELRLLTNLQLDSRPLLQIFLLGQEELKDLVHGPNMEQVHQRLVAAYNLEALKENETRQYIKHRLDQVGWKGDPALSDAVFPIIYKFSRGIPRRINLFCSRLFLHGSVEELHKLGVKDARIVINELQLENLSPSNIVSDIDFDTPDKYESADLESIEAPVATEPPAPNIQHKLGANRTSGTGTQKKNKNKGPVVVKKIVSSIKEKTENAENDTDTDNRTRGQARKPSVEKKSRQPTPDALGAEIDALDIGLEGLSDNVHALLADKKKTEQPTHKADTSARPRNRFVTLALFFTILLVLFAVVLFATTSKIFNTESISASSYGETVSPLETKKAALHLRKGGQIEPGATITIEENPFTEAASAGPDTRKNILPIVGKPSDEEEIHTTAEREQDSTSMKESENVDPANDQMRTDNITAMSIQNVGNEASHAESTVITGQSAADYGIQGDDTPAPGIVTEKVQEKKADRPVKKVYFQFDSADIQSDYYTELNEITGLLDASPETSALIIGYSDNVGKKEYNLDLSMKRARTVASYLASQGISTDRLRTDGRGIHLSEARSKSSTENILPYLNRVVEIYFISPVNQ